jgi:hypothetical protein
VSKEAEDTAILNDLDEEVGDNAMNNSNEEGTDDEIDPAVAESDNSIVDGVAVEIENDADLPMLTRTEVNLRRFAVTKVMTPDYHFPTTHIMHVSSETLENEYSIAPQSVQILRAHASKVTLSHG